MKKLLLSLGAVASVAAPVAAVVACGSTDDKAKSADAYKVATKYDTLDADGKAQVDATIKSLTASELDQATAAIKALAGAAGSLTGTQTGTVDALATAKAAAIAQVNSLTGINTATYIATINRATTRDKINEAVADAKRFLAQQAPKTPGTPTGTPGTGTPAGAKTPGTPAVSADNAKLYTGAATADALAADGTATVIITITGDDFENHISGEAAQAIEALLTTATKTTADVKKVELIVNDGTTKVSYITTVGNTGTAEQNLNAAINAASKEIADSNLLDHDVAFDATGAQAAIIKKLEAIAEKGFAGANDIFKALGNATKFNDDKHIQVVFGNPIAITTTPAQKLTSMLDAGVLGTFDKILKDAIKAAIAKLS